MLFLFGERVAVHAGAKPISRPNILFISIDDLNDWSGCLGNHIGVKTPNIDRLAKNGMLFSNAHCQAPLCGPSRASVYTGMYPHSTGIYNQIHDEEIKKSGPIAANAVFLPDYFEAFGYKTLGVGKLFHKGDNAGAYDLYGGVFPEMGFGPNPKKRVNFDPKWFTDKANTSTDWAPLNMDDSEMSDYKIAEWAVDALKQDHEKPFLMAVGFIRPHVPWHVPQKWFNMFPVESIELPQYKADDLDDVPEYSRNLHAMPQMPKTEWLIKEKQWKPMLQGYLACMAFMDHQLGKVLDALENSSYADNTVVVLWSDHGYHLGEKNRVCKHSLWQRSTHVPLIFAGAGIVRGQRCGAQVGLIDMYPTLVELCGLEANAANQGNSLVPLLNNPSIKWNHPAFTSYGYKNISIYLDGFHFIHYADGSAELYDTDSDPNEWRNLAGSSAYASHIRMFKQRLPKESAVLSPSCW
ncbi:sulfatase [Pontiella sulfatireligans]|uniref:sulfatase n=1 Tax=Pontiella sulfatireligans TaxID=2750658 RepID=UPI0038B682CB